MLIRPNEICTQLVYLDKMLCLDHPYQMACLPKKMQWLAISKPLACLLCDKYYSLMCQVKIQQSDIGMSWNFEVSQTSKKRLLVPADINEVYNVK